MTRCTQVTVAPRLNGSSSHDLPSAGNGTAPRAGAAPAARALTAAPATHRPSPEITSAEFRNAIGHFATGVTIVTSVGQDGEPVGTTANAVTSLSLDPPLLLVCFDRTSVTLGAVRAHGAFVVNVLAEPQRHLSSNFALRGRTATWEDVPHRPGRTGSPRLEGVLATLECTVEERLPGGDHEIIVGRVQDVETNGWEAAPLLYWRGGYGSLLGDAGGSR